MPPPARSLLPELLPSTRQDGPGSTPDSSHPVAASGQVPPIAGRLPPEGAIPAMLFASRQMSRSRSRRPGWRTRSAASRPLGGGGRSPVGYPPGQASRKPERTEQPVLSGATSQAVLPPGRPEWRISRVAPRDGVRSTCDSGRRPAGSQDPPTRASAGQDLTTDGISGAASRSTSASRPATHRD